MSRAAYVAVLVAALSSDSRLHAEIIDLPPAHLLETATHVMTGKVKAIFSRVEVKADYKYRDYVAEVAVEGIEKGKGLKKAQLVYVRYLTIGYVGDGLPRPGTSGHRGLPAVGETLRIYLELNGDDGGYDVVFPNGFETIQKAKTVPEKARKK